MSKAVGDLLARGLLLERAAKTHGPGRPIIPLVWNDRRHVLFGIKIVDEDQLPGRLVGVVTSLGGTLLHGPVHRELLIADGERTNKQAFVRAVARLVETMEDCLADGQEPLGVGVELGGHLDRGRVVLSVNVGWAAMSASWRDDQDFDLRHAVAQATGYQVVVHNDVNALAIRDNLYGMAGSRSFLVVAVFHDGVGGGLVLDGKPCTGRDGGAGELGHVKVDTSENARKCRCERLGHVEAYATPRAIMQDALFRNWEEAVRLPLSDDHAVAAFRLAGQKLGLAVANLATLANPDRVIFYLPPELAAPASGSAAAAYRSAVKTTIVAEAFSSSSATPCFFRPMSQSDADVHGAGAAASGVLQDFIEGLEGVSEDGPGQADAGGGNQAVEVSQEFTEDLQGGTEDVGLCEQHENETVREAN